MQKGYLVLLGGEAFTPRTRLIDHNWLNLIRQGQKRPRLMVIPAAATEKPVLAAQETVAHYRNLGTYPEFTEITDALRANTGQYYEALDRVEAIVLTDGSPADAVERLQGTHTQIALQKALQRRAAVMASGASAMALGGVYWMSGAWEPALAIAPQLAILPHHAVAQRRFSPEQLLAALPARITLLGIDDATAVISYPDGSYHADGEGEVTVYRSAEQQDVYTAGQQFTLNTPPG